MSVKRPLRSFSLYDSQRKLRHQRGGKSAFRNFLTSLGHAARPILREAERGLMNWGKQKLAKKVGVESINLGSNILKGLAEGNSIKQAAQSEEGRKLIRKGMQTGWNHIKDRIGGATTGVPDDIDRALTLENRHALEEALQPRRRRRRSRTKSGKKVGVRKKRAGVSKKRAGSVKRKKAGSVKRKKAGSVKRKKAGSVKRKKAGSVKRKKAGSVKRKKAGSVNRKKIGSRGKKVRFQFGGKVKKKAGGRKKSKKQVGTPKSIFD